MNCKISPAKVLAIRALRDKKVTLREISEMFKISITQVHRVVTLKSWATPKEREAHRRSLQRAAYLGTAP